MYENQNSFLKSFEITYPTLPPSEAEWKDKTKKCECDLQLVGPHSLQHSHKGPVCLDLCLGVVKNKTYF